MGASENSSDEGEDVRRGQRKPGQCLPKSKITSKLIIKSDGLESHIQYMKDHALIANFVGIWLIKKALVGWINMNWKLRRGYDLRLGSKGFFTIIFYNVEDKHRVFEGGSYFFNSVGLYLTF